MPARAFSDSIIAVENLAKTYKVHRRGAGLGATFRSLFHRSYELVQAVSELEFRIAPGERVGFLGPNGAGKTTTLKMLAGLLYPTAGELRVAGFVPARRELAFLRTITLVMGQKQQLLWDLPPVETFALNRAVYDIDPREFKATVAELSELLDIGKLIERPTRQLSLGERMKCELLCALLHKPKVLFLDEPTIGLDVSMQATMRQFIYEYNQRHGATILLTSHYMDDVVALCPRVIVIDRGRKIYDGDLGELSRRVRPLKHVVVKLAQPVLLGKLRTIGAVHGAGKSDDEPVAGQAKLEVAQAQVSSTVARVLAELPVSDLTIEDPPFEEIMRELFARPGESSVQP
jgi:ABC-2 type transport system ATP-binding protein